MLVDIRFEQFLISRYQVRDRVQWRTYFQDHLCCPISKVNQHNIIGFLLRFLTVGGFTDIYIYLYTYIYTE